jgi:hypothetical protein
MPPSAPVIALYLAELSTLLRPATIARRMAAITDRSKRAGYGTEALRNFAVQETWKGTQGPGSEIPRPLASMHILGRYCLNKNKMSGTHVAHAAAAVGCFYR